MNKLWISLAAALTLAVTVHAEPLSIGGVPAATKTVVTPTLRLSGATVATTTLGAVTAAEMARITQANRTSTKRTAIGIERDLGTTRLPSAGDMAWKSVTGGTAAQVAVSSPQAGAMRLGIDLSGVPANVEMVIFGSDDPSRLEGPVRVADIPDRTTPFWTPITDGDTQTIEFFVPTGIDAAALPLRLTGVAHLFTTLESGLKKRVSEIGEAESCEVDIKCSSLIASPSFQNMRSAVAQMVMQDSGKVFLCTGQLLNDSSATHTPWFYSANHCMDNENPPYKTPAQMQTVASTLASLWFFEAVTCSNPSDRTTPPYIQLNGGSTYIYSNQASDVLFVKLNAAPPTGSFFAGWDATAMPLGTAIVVVHHPQGDLKKVSQGSLVADSRFPGTTATNLFNEVKYSSGSTEAGSSGSGLFTSNGTDYRLRGALFGGAADCTAPTASDWYSQFDKAYSFLQPYLAPSPVPAFDYTDLWWNPNESGWGLNLVQHASNQVFGVWFTYGTGGRPAWYVLPGGTWTTPNTFTASVYATTGPSAASAAFNESSVVVRQAGTATLTFSDANNGTFAYTVDGMSSTKAITRQPY